MAARDSDPVAFDARIRVELQCPAGMVWPLNHVLEGEYETGYVGENLRVLDIGANAGAFSIWAAHRWPGSTIEAYEPDPGTFRLLQANTRSYPMIHCHNVAVYPSDNNQVSFTSRYTGDGEAGVTEVIADIFRQDDSSGRRFFDVQTIHPGELPPADIVKIDTEGAEAQIIKYANLSDVALLLMEFHHLCDLDTINAHVASRFETILEHRFPYADIMLKHHTYKDGLRGDYYGSLYLLRRDQTRLRRLQPSRETEPVSHLRLFVKNLLPPVLMTILKRTRDAVSR